MNRQEVFDWCRQRYGRSRIIRGTIGTQSCAMQITISGMASSLRSIGLSWVWMEPAWVMF